MNYVYSIVQVIVQGHPVLRLIIQGMTYIHPAAFIADRLTPQRTEPQPWLMNTCEAV